MCSSGIGGTAPGTTIEDDVVELGLRLHPEGFEETVIVETRKIVSVSHAYIHGNVITVGVFRCRRWQVWQCLQCWQYQ